MKVYELPEVVLYNIATFAAPPTQRASLLCLSIATLCRSSYRSIVEEERSKGLWDLVLTGDYGVNDMGRKSLDGSQRRSCKRLRRCPVEQVRDAHKILKDNTEIAYYYLWELSYSNQKNSLTKSKLCGIIDEYGPNLMFNRVMSSGANFLVEVCRSKNTTQHNILLCIQELVERRGMMVNLMTNESSYSSLTALCVAAVRGMPRVVEYLLSKGASKDAKCSGQFRLFVKKTKNLKCIEATPLEFAQKMLEAELAEGATNQSLKDLRRCIDLLQ